MANPETTALSTNSLPSFTHERAKLAAHYRHHPDVPVPDEQLTNLRAARMADWIARKVAEAPPLTPRQRELLARILNDPELPTAGAPARTAGGAAA